MSQLAEEIAALGAVEDPVAIAEQLSSLLGLTAGGLSVTGARVVGRGSRASADLYLSNGQAVFFETLESIARPQKLTVEITASTQGRARPKLNQVMAVEVLSLICKLAEHEETVTDDQIAVEWGRGYVQNCPAIDFDVSDQAERWGAFSRVQDRNEPEQTRHVLRDSAGTRYVRCCWFQDAMRREAPNVSESIVAHRMARVGWTRRNGQGKIKATRPGFRETRTIAFYLVPAGWEDER